MDDRSLVCKSDQQLIDDITTTDRFDAETGAVENRSKRQEWRRGEFRRIEHIGVEAAPDDPTASVTPAGGWKKVYAAIAALRQSPG
eukprot:1414892-Pyramimonas_sp.AAC.1